MGQLTAGLRGAAAGDTVTLVAANGTPTTVTRSALVADDATLGGTEMLDVAGRRRPVGRSCRAAAW